MNIRSVSHGWPSSACCSSNSCCQNGFTPSNNGISDNVDIIFLFTTTADRDNDGDIIYNSDGRPETVTTFTIQTDIHF